MADSRSAFEKMAFGKQLNQILNNARYEFSRGGVVGDLVRGGLNAASQDPFVQRLSPNIVKPYGNNQHTLSQGTDNYRDIGGANQQFLGTLLGDPLNLVPAVAPALNLSSKATKALGKEALRQIETGTGIIGKNVVDPRMYAVQDVRTNVGQMPFDPRFDERVLEQEKLKKLTTVVERDPDIKLPTMSLVDFEGKPFITSMSDRLAAGGLLKEINNKKLNTPIALPGGQDYMLYNDAAWASGVKPAKELLDMANMIYRETGQNPIYIPHRMAPTGGDFAHATGETMISYADTALSGNAKKTLNSLIKKIVPDWVGVNNPKSLDQYRNLSATKREAIREVLDKKFRNEGGLGLGEARLSVADTTQLNSPVGGIMNIGEIFANKPLSNISNNTSYPKKLEGRGIARLNENENINIYQLLEDLAKERKVVDPKNPSNDDMRALMMKPYSGRITSEMLKRLGF